MNCSIACSRQCRERRRLEKRRTGFRAAARTLVAVERSDGQARLLAAEQQYQRSLEVQNAAAVEEFHTAILQRDRTIDDLRSQLQRLATINVDLCGDRAETKAESIELRLEGARFLGTRRTDVQDLMQLALRLLQLTDRPGIPLDPPTAEIYRRRGWNTKIPARSR
ncbi:hypothetical protein [Arthrobacter sp. A5]|uniref:hypothetical protein n=1 Tax=Arthrobacter sp. A5 TaxID=576926 RepID=UPI003DA949D3